MERNFTGFDLNSSGVVTDILPPSFARAVPSKHAVYALHDPSRVGEVGHPEGNHYCLRLILAVVQLLLHEHSVRDSSHGRVIFRYRCALSAREESSHYDRPLGQTVYFAVTPLSGVSTRTPPSMLVASQEKK